MNSPKTHLILVSAQPIPNLTPILDDCLRPKKVIMLVSDDMQERSIALENIYKPRGIAVDRHRIQDPWNAEQISDQVLDILAQYPNGDIALNATGGTKLMAIAAYEAFRSCNYPIFYIHPEQDLLIWLSPKQRDINLDQRITLKDYLMAYGASSVEVATTYGVPEHIRTLTQNLITGIERYSNELATLNYLAYKADNLQLTTDIPDGPLSKPHLWELLDLFVDAGLCQINGQKLQFKDQNARFITNGGWLELHTYSLCLNLKKELQIQDIATNISIERQLAGKDRVNNEIDVALIKSNRLHLIECKTQQFKKDEKSADVLYKLDSLRDLMGGLQGRAMLVSFNPLDKASRARAKELKINLCSKTELQNLQKHIQDWLLTER
jgi:hypothetical protein